jgi:methyl-galactoside transport system substrate-binding protein
MKYSLIGLVLILMGCQPVIQQVPVLYYDMNDAYIADFKERLSSIEKEPLVHIDGGNRVNTQNEQFTQWIEQSSVLVVNPVDRLSVLPMILKANQLNKTIIFFNREPLDEDFAKASFAYYVGADPFQSAQLQTQLVDELQDSQRNQPLDRNDDGMIQLVILKGEQGHQDAEIRTRGVIETLLFKGYSLDILEVRVANFDRTQAYKSTLDLMETYPNMELIISNNDAMALGAIDALVDMDWIQDVNQNGVIEQEEPWFPVIGIDGLPEAIDSMQKGYLFGTVKNDSEAMADAIVQLIDIVLNKATWDTLTYTIEDRKIYIDYILINRP